MTTQASVSNYDNSGLDMIELVQKLWTQKWLIAGVTLFVLSLSLWHAITSTPIYQSTASVIAPKRSDIAAYNEARLSIASAVGRVLGGNESAESPPPVFTTEEVYNAFRRNLFSASLRNSFFTSYYLPYLGEGLNEDQAARGRLLSDFKQVLVVREPDPQQRPGYFEVSVELDDPAIAAQWANGYIAAAGERAEKDMSDDISSEVENRRRMAVQQIKAMRDYASAQRNDRVAQIEEALQVALALGIDAPQITAGRVNADSELAAFVEGNLMYMRGANALKAELDVLRNREVNDPFVPELRRLESRLEMLRNISVNPDSVAVYSIDGVAEIPDTPIRPRKAMIVALGLILGVVLGVGIALARIIVRERLSN